MKRKIGQTPREVFPIGLGAMPLSIEGRPDEKQALEVIHAAMDAGVTLIDTADSYCFDDSEIGHNERLIRKALDQREDRQKITVATKGGLRRPNGDWVIDGSPAHLRDACEKSLKALNLPSIFLYQFHSPDDQVPFEESIGELARLQKEGKIQHIGLSNVHEEELELALSICRIESIQNRCNPFQQTDIRTGLIDLCAKNQVTYLAYSPVGGSHSHRLLAQNSTLIELSRHYQATPYQLTLAWLLAQGPNVIPTPGASRVSSIRDSAKAVKIQLRDEDKVKINQLSPI